MMRMSGYQIHESIHESSSSFVYRGQRERDGQAVILKVLKAEYPSPAERSRYRQEYEMTQSLSLECVIKTFGLETFQHSLAIVFEDFGGHSLQHLLKQQPFSLQEMLNVAIRTADCLAELHAANIIHKNLNPSNIVFNPRSGQLKLIDFGIATRLSREHPSIRHPRVLEGTLAYMSPEQTGRMNRSLDYRTDLYSLGATFYEMLTGQCPFVSDDPLELTHDHLAKMPLPPHEIIGNRHSATENSPLALLSAIILKLMAKMAEDRYQSALGLKKDLEYCLEHLHTSQERGVLAPFELGQHDVLGRFQIPEKLYGREQDIQILLQTFERVSTGATELLLVKGGAGVGKSSLIHEVHKAITEKRGNFIAGKFDQLQREIPYFALIQAFQGIVDLLLSEKDDVLATCKTRILHAVGNLGKVLLNVIPDLELVIGEQPEIPELDPGQAQNRFNLVFGNFVRAIARQEHPLVLAIDDLQWADSASLMLLKLLINDRDLRYMLLIGAYREHELGPAHPLSLTLEELQQEQASMTTIRLRNLSQEHVGKLVGETLLHPEWGERLAGLLYKKTRGNAFFVKQLFQALYDDRLLEFDAVSQCWHWDMRKIQQVGITNNVVEFMAAKVQNFPETVQQLLTLAACIGNRFDLETLAIIAERSPRDTAQTLLPALVEGLIVDTAPHLSSLISHLSHLKFSHDRIQEAAYSLIPEQEKARLHLKIGRLLRKQIPQDQQAERLFDIVNQFNAGRPLLDRPEEFVMLAELNLQAGEKAKASSAYHPALRHFEIGIDLLPEESWTSHHALTFALHRERYECESLTCRSEKMEALFAEILAHAENSLEMAEMYNIAIVHYTAMGKNEEAISKGREALKLLDMELPEHDVRTAAEREFKAIAAKLRTKQIADLIHLPIMDNREREEGIKLLLNLHSPTHHSDPELWSFITGKIVHLALEYGNTRDISSGYAAYGMILGSGQGRYQAGYEFGRVALQLSENFENTSQTCKTSHVLGNFINCWRTPVKSCVPFLQQAFRYGLESGELLYAGHALGALTQALFSKGEALSKVLEHIEHAEDFAKRIGNSPALEGSRRWRQFILCLQGRTEGPRTYKDSGFDETRFLEEIKDNPGLGYNFYLSKLHALYLYGAYHDALTMAQEADIRAAYNFGSYSIAEQNFYSSLTLCAIYPGVAAEEQQAYRNILSANQRQMNMWSENCLENFHHKYLLVEAEIARLDGRNCEALTAYRRAVEEAHDYGFLQNEALGNELLAKFWLAQGDEKLAGVYMSDAYYGYQLWGAAGKLADMEERYPRELLRISETGGRAAKDNACETGNAAGRELDFAAVMKASQAISGEIVLEKLLARLMEIVIENAGAESGLLLFEEDGEWSVKAEAPLKKACPEPAEGPVKGSFPSTIITYVARTKKPLVLENAAQEGRFTQDRYILEQQPKSALCAPLLNQGKLLGILYLENNLTTAAFTPARLEVLHFLSAQAAISVENAGLYNHLERKVAERTQELADTIDRLQQEILEREIAENALQRYREQLEDLVDERTAELTQSNTQLQQEIRERHHAEQAVRSSEQQYRALAEHVADGLVVMQEGTPVFVNDALCSMLKYSSDHLLRIDPVELFREQDRELFLAWFQKLLQGNTLPSLQAVCRTRDGREIWTEGRSSPIDWEGEPATLVTVRDITERKMRELEIEERRKQLQQENIVLRSTMKERYKFGELIGKSVAMQEVYQSIAHASSTNANVAIYGESGTGKELTARTIHQLSERRQHPFTPVNCGAIPENLFESEFFGHRRGAFTGADRDHSGFFAAAHKGSLFLDEIGELTPTMQVKLLRALESGEYIRLGEQIPRHADVRIIAATNKDLTKLLRKGAMREDFFYRIHVVTITLPPLRERREDIPLLVDYFLEHENSGKARVTLPGDILALLYRYDWPGNVRELQNTLQRYLVMGRLDFVNAGVADSAKREALPDMELDPNGRGLQHALDSLEKQLLLQALEHHYWHRGKTAVSLGIPRRSLQRKMKKHGLM